jgi:DNA-directed RNA polymerase subunit RPC12/RpoP
MPVNDFTCNSQILLSHAIFVCLFVLFEELDPFDFVCDHCGKKFLGIANMKRHLRVHMGSEGKDFACPLCHYRGCTTTHVKRHMAHKHLEK